MAGAVGACSSPATARSPVQGGAAEGLLSSDRAIEEGGVDGGDPTLEPSGSGPVTWRPLQGLPSASASSKVRVVLSPHPDDETLSMGVWAANAAREGCRVIVVCLTDGRGTKARTLIGARLHRVFTRDEVAAARIGELRAAVADLGVDAEDVVLAHLDGDETAGGSRLTQAEASAVIQIMAERFPNATFATMSYTADRHPDHLDVGRALWQAIADGTVRSGVFAVSRLWLRLPSPPNTTVLPSSLEVAQRVRAAGHAYGVWDPAHLEYAVGWTSVRQQFLDLDADPRNHLHAWQPEPAPSLATPSGRPLVTQQRAEIAALSTAEAARPTNTA